MVTIMSRQRASIAMARRASGIHVKTSDITPPSLFFV
jgi:hypothetical protein